MTFQEWPKMMYHTQTKKGKVFNTQEEVEEGYLTYEELNSKPVAKQPKQPSAPPKSVSVVSKGGLDKYKALRAQAKKLGIPTYKVKKDELQKLVEEKKQELQK